MSPIPATGKDRVDAINGLPRLAVVGTAYQDMFFRSGR